LHRKKGFKKGRRKNGVKKTPVKKRKLGRAKANVIQKPRQIDANCIDNAVKYMVTIQKQVAFFDTQKTRMETMEKQAGGKAKKMGNFQPLCAKIREAGGGNSSDLRCNGEKSENLTNLYSELMACKENINTSCSTDMPTHDENMVATCVTDIKAFKDLVKAASDKTGDDACLDWNGANLAAAEAKALKCKVTDESNAVKAQKKKCINAFSKCRKTEDAIIDAFSKCMY